MTNKRLSTLAVAGLAGAVIAAPAAAQDWKAKWDATLAKAKSQTLVMTQHGNDGIPPIVAEFTKKFGIKVNISAQRPSRATARIRTEQKNGKFLWDVWVAATSNMTNIAAPAGMMVKLDDHLILPEVTDMSNWRDSRYVFGEKGHRVFTFANYRSGTVYRNLDVAKGVEVKSMDDFMNPKFNGLIAMREAGRPNAGAFFFALMQSRKGADFLTNFLKTAKPRVFESPKQIFNSVVRGNSALGIGMRNSEYTKCRRAGGCKNIVELPGFDIALSWGTAIFKNAPNPEAAAVWVNWILSKEGQTSFVKNWSAHNSDGAISMRKDVAPAKGHEPYQIDFKNPQNYVWVAQDKGRPAIMGAVKTYRQAKGQK